jgi:hypothetical protein
LIFRLFFAYYHPPDPPATAMMQSRHCILWAYKLTYSIRRLDSKTTIIYDNYRDYPQFSMEADLVADLNDTLWERVTRILAGRGETFMDLYRALPDEDRPHDNTLYSWKAKKTIMKINDLEILARALDVSPALLLTPIDEDNTLQLELPFETGTHLIRLEVECQHNSIKLRGLQD